MSKRKKIKKNQKKYHSYEEKIVPQQEFFQFNTSLTLFHNTAIEQDKRIQRLQNKIDFLQEEKKNLTKAIREFEVVHREWLQEKSNLTRQKEQLEKKALSYEHSMSFRLGYALIFGFKSWTGFKHLIKTLYTLPFEKRTKKQQRTEISVTLRKPDYLTINWKGRRTITQWTSLPQKEFKDFIELFAVERLELRNRGFFQTIACKNIDQLVLSINIDSEETPKQTKQALAAITFLDKDNNTLESSIELPQSKKLGKYYFYLNTEKDQQDNLFIIPPLDCENIKLDIVPWDIKGKISVHNKVGISHYTNGISIILPTYKGVNTIKKCLDSLNNQDLSYSLFEIIVVMNGPKDGTEELLRQYKLENPNLNLRYYSLKEANVSKARNFAIQKAKFSWTTFIDDDDYVDTKFLSSLYSKAMYNTLTLTGIEDVYGEEIVVSPITKQLDKAILKDDIQYNDVTSTLTMNACKLVPTYMVKSVEYDSNLRSGEDVVFWSEVLAKFMPRVSLVPEYQYANYKRVVRDNSVSRQKESYDFNVLQRLEVIKKLSDLIKGTYNQYINQFIQSKIKAQSGFITRYLKKNPDDFSKCIRDIQNLKINNHIIRDINALFSDTLIISYCFAPFIDTSGVVMSKRIREMNKPVDIIYNNMDKVRPIDEELMLIADPYLGETIKLNSPQSFSNWHSIEQFATNTLVEVAKLFTKRRVYKSIYSRAMWLASHFAAAILKIKYPQLKWSAEFSDPVLMDVSGKARFEELPIEWLIHHGFISGKTETYINNNLFYWCEALPYLYADELIFTNENQLEYMLSYADESHKDIIRSKAVILPQPTLPRNFYEISCAKIELDNNYTNLAYFGSFYVNRGFTPFVDAWKELPNQLRESFRLYIYTQQNRESILETTPKELHDLIIIQPYVSYFDFLHLSDQFDALVVMDAETEGLKVNNPYLPSKISDYLGSKSDIIALIETGSPMSKINHPNLFKVELKDKESIISILPRLNKNKG
ncbi:TPA: glycosyltransferase [Haemophilus influenzae]